MNFNYLSGEFNKKGYIYIETFFNDSLMDICHKKILTHFASNPEYLAGIGHRMAAIKDSRLLPIVQQSL